MTDVRERRFVASMAATRARELEEAAEAVAELELRLDRGPVYVRRHPPTLDPSRSHHDRGRWREGSLPGDGPDGWIDGDELRVLEAPLVPPPHARRERAEPWTAHDISSLEGIAGMAVTVGMLMLVLRHGERLIREINTGIADTLRPLL